MNKTDKRNYGCVFSLGEVCFCASYLRKMRLRHFSAPFDWIAGGTFAERISFLLDGFKGFLEEGDMEFYGRRDYPEPCDIYRNKHTRMVFNHDFPLNKDLSATFPVVKEKYNRRINALYKNIQAAEKVLLVYMEQAETSSGIKSGEELVPLVRQLNEKFRPVQVDLLYIRHNEQMKDGEFSQKRLSPNVCLAECYNRRRHDDVPSAGNYDNVKKIFKNITCKNNFFRTIGYECRRLLRNIGKMVYRRKIKQGREYIRVLGIKFPLPPRPKR